MIKGEVKLPFESPCPDKVKKEAEREIEEFTKLHKDIIPDGYKVNTYDDFENPRYITIQFEDNVPEYLQTDLGLQEEKKKRSIRKLKENGLYNLSLEKRFDNYETKEDFQKLLKARAKAFVKDYKGNFFSIFGESGSGKSHLCIALATELINNGVDLMFVLWNEELNHIRYNQEEYSKWMTKMKRAEVLYLDDFLKEGLGTYERLSDFELRTAFEIINARYNSNLTTIISSEIPPQRLMEINEAIISRIKERGNRKYYNDLARTGKRNYRHKL